MPRRVLQGTVVGIAGKQTVIVRVERRIQHQRYKKFILRSKKYAAHDQDCRCKSGDLVQIRESRPFSKTKNWEVIFDAA